MRILLVNKFFYLKGGSEKHFFDLKKLLEKNGHQVIVFSTEDGRNEKTHYNRFFAPAPNFKSFSGVVNYFYSLSALQKFSRLLSLTFPDIIHLHNISRYISPSVIAAASKAKIPIVQTVHDYQLVCPNYKLFNGKEEICTQCFKKKYWNAVKNKCSHHSYIKSFLAGGELFLNSRLYRDKVSKFISPSKFVKNMLVQGGVDERKIEVLTHFLFLEDYAREIIGGNNEQTADSAQNEIFFLYAGRLVNEKGVKFLVELWKDVGSRAKLVIAGDGPMRREVEEFVEKNNLESSVTFAGNLNTGELSYLTKKSLAVLIPSLWLEPFSYAAYESMALGKAVIVSRLGGLSELIIHDVTGLLVEAGSKEAWLEAITRAIDFPLEMKAMGFQARALMENFSSSQKYYEQLMRVYNEAMTEDNRITTNN